MGVDVSGTRVGVDVSGIGVKWLSHSCVLTIEALGIPVLFNGYRVVREMAWIGLQSDEVKPWVTKVMQGR